jgi:hypothetical protein
MTKKESNDGWIKNGPQKIGETFPPKQTCVFLDLPILNAFTIAS